MKKIASLSKVGAILFLLYSAPLFAQWTNAVIDTITRTQVRKETTPQSLCLDDSGLVHLVWKHQRTEGWRIFYCTNSPAGTWGTPQEVADSMHAAFDPAIAWWSTRGTPLVVYEQDSEIYAAYLSGGLWQAESITANAQLDCSPTIAIDGWGLPHVAWITNDSTTGQYKIAYATGYLVGPYISWANQTLIGSDLGPYGTGGSPFIAVTSEGVAHIVYRGGDYENYHIHHAWNDAQGGTNWNYEILYSGNWNDFRASMVIEDDGDYHLAVSGNDGWGLPGRVFYFHKPNGQPWQQHELVSGTYSAVQPSLSVDEYGAPHIVWREIGGLYYTGDNFYSAKDSTGIWQTLHVIGNDHLASSFQVDQQGYGHVACYTGCNTAIYDIYHVKSGDVLTGIETPEIQNVIEYALSQNCPNPFKTETRIHYQLPRSGFVTIAIYDLSGQRVKILVNEPKDAGYYTIRWNGQNQDNQRVSNGVYFCRMKAGEYTSTKKILLMR